MCMLVAVCIQSVPFFSVVASVVRVVALLVLPVAPWPPPPADQPPAVAGPPAAAAPAATPPKASDLASAAAAAAILPGPGRTPFNRAKKHIKSMIGGNGVTEVVGRRLIRPNCCLLPPELSVALDSM